MDKIDLVIAYVNNNDIVWRKQFIKICTIRAYYPQIANLKGQRYDDIGLFETNLKLIKKNMSWINKVYLLVSNKEQVPNYAKDILGDKLVVVLHHQFIYSQYLPTFNSTTIEMFLWNIKGLSNKFIYMNDDMFPVGELQPSDFFENDKIKIDFLKEPMDNVKSQFRKVCINSYVHLVEILDKKLLKENYYLRPLHSFTPMIKDNCKKCFKLLGKTITNNIGRFRTEYQHNQYIYPIYEYLVLNRLKSGIKFKYLELRYPIDTIEKEINENQIVCINDNGAKNKVDIKKLKELLERKVWQEQKQDLKQ